MEDVQGYCPMGCGQTLFLGSGGYVTCRVDKCPNPTAVSDILNIRETEHLVEFDGGGFSLQHPLRERIEGELFSCTLHQRISSFELPPVKPGRFRASELSDGRIHWESVR